MAGVILASVCWDDGIFYRKTFCLVLDDDNVKSLMVTSMLLRQCCDGMCFTGKTFCLTCGQTSLRNRYINKNDDGSII